MLIIKCNALLIFKSCHYNANLFYSQNVLIMSPTVHSIGMSQKHGSFKHPSMHFLPLLTPINKMWQTLTKLSLHYTIKKHHQEIAIEDEDVQTYSKHLPVIW